MGLQDTLFGNAQDTVSAKEIVLFSDNSNTIQIPDAALLFKADFERDGPDLLLVNDEAQTVRIVDYFRHEAAPDLVAPEGGLLTGDVVTKLAGPQAPGQYAQATANDANQTPIGQVETLEGAATVQRANGTTETLKQGDKVFQNDVVQTADGGSLSITFVDGTIFTLAASSRMVLDALVYDPASNSNSGVFNLIEGSFVFIAGQVAKTGGMDVKTPSGTMGIRGTTVKVDIVSEGGVTRVNVSLNRDPNGDVGRFEITDLNGNLIATVTSTETQWVISPIAGETREIPRTADGLLSDQALLTEAVNAFQLANNRVEAGGEFVDPSPGNNQGPEGPEGPGDNDGPQDNDDGSNQNNEREGNLRNDSRPTDFASLEQLDDTDEVVEEETRDLLGEERTIREVVLGQAADDEERREETTQDTPPDPVLNAEEQPVEITFVPPEINISVNEDGSVSLTGFALSLGSNVPVTVTIVAGSTVTLAPGSGVEILEGTGTNDERIVFRGTVDQVISALNGDGEGSDGSSSGLIYTASPNDDDGGTLDITISAGTSSFSTQLQIPITPTQDPPQAVDDAFTLPTTTSIIVGNVLDNDSDPDVTPTPDVLSVTSATLDGTPVTIGSVQSFGDGASFVINADGSFVLNPGQSFISLPNGQNFSVALQYVVDDGNGNTDSATATVSVVGTDGAPFLAQDEFTVPEDANFSSTLIGTDPEGQNVTFALNTGTTNGTVVVNPDGSFDYTAATDFFGTDIFTVDLTDENGTTGTQSVFIIVQSVNDAPNVADQNFATDQDTNLSGQLAASDVDGDILIFDIDTQPPTTDGVVLVGSDGAFTFTPQTGFSGSTSFTFTVDDQNGGLETRTAFITVNPTGNTPPDVTDQAFSTNEDTVLNGELLASDNDDDNLTFSLSTTPPAAEGSVVINNDGTFTFTPAADFNGSSSFDFQVDDGNNPVETRTATITINPVNDDPSVANQSFTTDEAVALNGQLVATDADNDTLTFSLFSAPASSEGTVVVNSDGSFTFTPTGSFNGTSSFDFEVEDGNSGFVSRTATVTVNNVDQPPVLSFASDAILQFSEDDDASLVNNTLTISDPDSTNIAGVTVEITSGFQIGDILNAPETGPVSVAYDASTGILTLSGNATLAFYESTLNQLTYVNNLDGIDETQRELTYTITDTEGASSTATRFVDVTNVNDDPSGSNLPGPIVVGQLAPTFISFGSLTIIDPDLNDDVIVTVTVDEGTFNAVNPGSVVSPNLTVNLSTVNFQTISLIGSPIDISAYLQGANISYDAPDANPGFNGTISFFVNDGNGSGAISIGTVSILADLAPTIASVNPTPSFIEGSTAVTVDDTIALSDLDDIDLEGATVQITSGFQVGDVLQVNTSTSSPIGIVYNPTTGVLSLTGNGLLSEYQDLLRSITFENNNDDVNETPRVIEFTVTDGTNISDTHTITLNVTAQNDFPEINTENVNPNLVINGGFEDGFDSAASSTLVTNNQLNGFQIGPTTTTAVELLTGTGLGEFGGENSVDLGVGNGAISTLSQTIATTPNVTYEITFQSFSESGFSQVPGRVKAPGLNQTFGDTVTSSAPVDETFTFTATGATSTITFEPTLNNLQGIVIDNVAVRELFPDNTLLTNINTALTIDQVQFDDPDGDTGTIAQLVIATNALDTTSGNGTLTASPSAGITLDQTTGDTITIQGTRDDINTYLLEGNVTYTPPSSTFIGAQELVFTFQDNGDGITSAPSFSVQQTLQVVVGNVADVEVGTRGGDTISTFTGSQVVFGLEGLDNIATGFDDDVIIGGDGPDSVDGQNGNDFISTGAGNDSIQDGVGFDIILAGDGDDNIREQSNSIGTIDGGDGFDELIFADAGSLDVSIDLTSLPTDQLTNLERINTTFVNPTGGVDPKNYTITLNEQVLFNLAGSNTLDFVAEAGDNIILQVVDTDGFQFVDTGVVSGEHVIELQAAGSGALQLTLTIDEAADVTLPNGSTI